MQGCEMKWGRDCGAEGLEGCPTKSGSCQLLSMCFEGSRQNTKSKLSAAIKDLKHSFSTG